MDEMISENVEGQEQVQEVAEHSRDFDNMGKNVNEAVAETAKAVFTNPEGAFLGFALTLVIGYITYAFTRNEYQAKFTTVGDKGFAIAKNMEK